MSKIQEALKQIQANDARQDMRPDAEVKLGPERSGAEETSAATSRPLNRKKINVDWEALFADGLVPPPQDEDNISRQIRDIKRPVIGNAFGRRAIKVNDGNLVMVSSALSGEGKTFVAFNLARSMAKEQDHSVVLVDADVAKPHTSKIFGLENELGLLDILERPDVTVESAIFDTDIPGLSILPAGKPRPNSTELLASTKMEQFVHELASTDRGRIVIFDTPPLLQTSESKVLASFVGQIVMVVGAGRTPRGAVEEAVELLGEDKVVNLILNMAKTKPNFIRGGYGSDYGSHYPATKAGDSAAGKRGGA